VRPRIWIIWLCFVTAASARAGLTHQEALDLFHQANEAFRTANGQADPAVRQPLYDKAVLAYEKIIQDGPIRNARLHYNLANAYLLKGDVGRAILNYRRAEELDGGDVNVRKNLAFARTRRIDTLAVKTEQQVLSTLLFWHYDLGMKTRLVGACLAMAVLCLSLAAMVWRGFGTAWISAAAVGAVVLLCLGGSAAVDLYGRANTSYGVITAAEVAARQGDGPNYPESFKAPLHAGTEFQLIEKRPGWLHIRLSDGGDTWVAADAASLVN
jgi:tetratricopeptide (TPR) repeat protein